MSYSGLYFWQEASRDGKLCSAGLISRARNSKFTKKIYLKSLLEDRLTILENRLTIPNQPWMLSWAFFLFLGKNANFLKSDKRFVKKKTISMEITHILNWGDFEILLPFMCWNEAMLLPEKFVFQLANNQPMGHCFFASQECGQKRQPWHTCTLTNDVTSKELNMSQTQKMWLKIV